MRPCHKVGEPMGGSGQAGPIRRVAGLWRGTSNAIRPCSASGQQLVRGDCRQVWQGHACVTALAAADIFGFAERHRVVADPDAAVVREVHSS